MSDRNFVDVEPWKRVRYLIIFLINLGFAAIYMIRTSMSIAIVAMTHNNYNSDYETFDWDLSTQGTILSSFFWGYVATNVPGAILIQKYGSRWVFLISTMVGAISTILFPVGALYGGWPAACALRIVHGASQGPYFAAFHSAATKWLTPSEKTRLSSSAIAGCMIGIAAMLATGGALADSAGGWPSIFYVCGSVNIAWCVVYYFVGYSSPAEHPFVSELERNYIESQYISATTKPSFYIPWLSLAKSAPLWTLCYVYCAHCWGFYMFLTEMPTYINNILKYDIKDNGLLSALPYVVLFCAVFPFAWLAEFVQKNVAWTRGWNRRIFTAIAFLMAAISLAVLTVIDRSDNEAAIVLLVFGVTGTAAGIPGFQINQMDLSPKYAPILMGITNGVGNAVSAIVPVAVSAIISDETDINDWYKVFWTSSGIYASGCIVYFLFGSEQIQSWNDLTDENKNNASEKSKKMDGAP